jgi:hypothetical protein
MGHRGLFQGELYAYLLPDDKRILGHDAVCSGRSDIEFANETAPSFNRVEGWLITSVPTTLRHELTKL